MKLSIIKCNNQTVTLTNENIYDYEGKTLMVINSSFIREVEIHLTSESHGELILWFGENYRCYVYSNVKRDTIIDFINAESFGKFYNYNIKGRYHGELVD